MKETAARFEEVILDASRLHPDMRLGQLFDLLAALAGEDSPQSIAHLNDHRLADAGQAYVERRMGQLGLDRAALATRSLPAGRRVLVTALFDMQRRRDGADLGNLLAHWGESIPQGLYDVDDDDLQSLVRSELTARVG